MGDQASSRGVYGIAVAAELVGVGEQTLRLYERKGLLNPTRTGGGTRRYSDYDLTVMRQVMILLDEGLNLVGARRVIELENINQRLHERIAELTGSRTSHPPTKRRRP